MTVTIIKDDSAVIVDGVRRTVDCSDLPADFHALQWDGTHGEVEYSAVQCEHCKHRSKKPNAAVSDFTPYAKYLEAWHAAGQEH